MTPLLASLLLAATAAAPLGEAAPAPDFTLAAANGGQVTLSKELEKGPVVLVVLRGYPGYQCPLCSRQVGEFNAAAAKFRKAGATLLYVYPGPADALGARADEFLKGVTLPAGTRLLLDPGYEFTNRYHLRWDAPNETAYPSTFVIDKSGTVRFAKVSKTHGGRTAVPAVLAAVESL